MNDGIIIAQRPLQPRYRYKIHDNLYDLTDFVEVHPGGIDMFNNLKPDTNITPMIYAYHKNPKNILTMLPKYEVPFTDDIKIEYDNNYTYDKYCELKTLVYMEIHEKKIPLHWSNTEISYNAFMVSVYLGMWIYSFYYIHNLSYWFVLFHALFGTSICGGIWHEVSHNIGFKNIKLNRLISSYIVFPFVDENEWKFRHNYLHHCFTNTKNDVDFYKNDVLFRFSTNSVLYFHHKFQCMYIYILFILNGHNKAIFRNITNRKYTALFFVCLLWYFFRNKILFFIGVTGLQFTFLSSLSHIHHECVEINTENKNDFLYNQISSSMNYRTDDFITRFLSMTIDIQIEHHVFPHLPHSSLRKIQHIVRSYCNKNNIPYIEKPNIFHSIYSSNRHLFKMGNP